MQSQTTANRSDHMLKVNSVFVYSLRTAGHNNGIEPSQVPLCVQSSFVIAELHPGENLQARIVGEIGTRQSLHAAASDQADVAQAGQPAERDDAPGKPGSA